MQLTLDQRDIVRAFEEGMVKRFPKLRGQEGRFFAKGDDGLTYSYPDAALAFAGFQLGADYTVAELKRRIKS